MGLFAFSDFSDFSDTFIIQSNFVCNQRNKFRICRFPLAAVHRVSKEAVQGIKLSSAPGNLNGMADGALHPAGGGTVALGDFRVQALGHRVDILRLVHREQDGVPQELVALDVGGDVIREGQ